MNVRELSWHEKIQLVRGWLEQADVIVLDKRVYHIKRCLEILEDMRDGDAS